MLTIILMKQSNIHFFYVSFLQVVDFLPQTELTLVNYVRLLNKKGASELS